MTERNPLPSKPYPVFCKLPKPIPADESCPRCADARRVYPEEEAE